MDECHTTDLPEQQRLIQRWLALLEKTEPAVSVIETHVSWILVIGQYAYKVKKALQLDFLDYSDLALRRFYCREEIRLNRRTAPGIYLDVVQIGGTREAPELNSNPALEYAVKMRRFDDANQLDRLLEAGRLTSSHIDSLASAIARFHLDLTANAEQDNAAFYGMPSFVLRDLVENLQELGGLLKEREDIALWEAMKQAQIAEFTACRDLFTARCRNGFVREGHGDLHMGNLVVVDGQVVPFDGIDFDPAYRFRDVMSDVAFAFMDLLYYGKAPFAWRLVNTYLQQTGDDEGVALLRFYAAYHATVRAKVRLIRSGQENGNDGKASLPDAPYRRYMKLARAVLTDRVPALIVTSGLPGSGKTVFARMAVEKLSGIALCSDVFRERLYGRNVPGSVEENSDSRYTPQAKEQVYGLLLESADALLKAGMTVIVDAAFLKASQRELFRKLAESRAVPFAVAAISADPETLKTRVRERQEMDDDASEATPDVLTMLMEEAEPFREAELSFVVNFTNEGDTGFDDQAPGWEALGKKIKSDEKPG